MSWLKKLWSWLTSSEINSAVVLASQVAGGVAGTLIVNNVDKNNKSGTAKDILSIGDAVLSLLTGTIPTNGQIATVMADLKADAATTNYAAIGQQFLSAFQEQLTAFHAAGYTDKAIIAYAKAFINGMITGANLAAK